MLIDQIYGQARDTPEKPALIVDGQTIPYRAFAAVIDRSRSYLAAQARPADAFAVLPTGSNATVWVLLLALRSLGLTTIAVPSGNSIGALGLPEARCVVAVSGEHPPGLDRVCAAAGLRFIDVPTEIYAGVADAAVPGPPEPAAPFGGHILLTSGTTGAYKKVGLDPSHQPSQMAYRREIFGITGQSVVNVFNLGCWTAGGHNFTTATWDVGGAVVMYQQPNLWKSLRTPGITHSFVFPHLLSEILQAPEGELARNDAMRLISTGGPLSQALVEAAKARLTSRIYNYLGATEAGGYTFTPIESAEDLRWHRVIPSRRVEVVDEQGRVLPVGQTGFVRVDLAGGVTGYLHDEAATRAFFCDGFFYPGDLGVFRADGRLALQGRVTDVINILGQKIASAPIE
jgi:acyl-CoA synthetase (AMP-forming)/AMP-acid ligase II